MEGVSGSGGVAQVAFHASHTSIHSMNFNSLEDDATAGFVAEVDAIFLLELSLRCFLLLIQREFCCFLTAVASCLSKFSPSKLHYLECVPDIPELCMPRLLVLRRRFTVISYVSSMFCYILQEIYYLNNH